MITKKMPLLLLLLIGVVSSLKAQNVTLSGYISEEGSGERLLGATIFVPDKNVGTTSNTYGFYSLTLPADTYTVHYTYLGYKPIIKKLYIGNDVKQNIELTTDNTMEEVVVTAKGEAIQNSTRMSTIDIPVQTIKSLPAFLGEVDVMRAIQLLPGIQGGNEGSTGIYVRGGGPDQNLILLDGVPVYNASHLFGFFSVFNADAIRSVEVIKGGFPARYGGRLSSVIDINMKEGSKEKIHGEGGIGLIASRLTLEGPIQKGKSSFMISGRRTYYDLLTKPFLRGKVKGGYYFYDLNGKANFQLGKKDHLYISGYFGNDKFYMSEKTDGPNNTNSDFKSNIRWGNATAVARWNHEYSSKLFGNLTAHYSQYEFNISGEQKNQLPSSGNELYGFKYTSGIQDKAVKYDFDFVPGPSHFIKAGVGFTAHRYMPGAQQIKLTRDTLNSDTAYGAEDIYANEFDAYIEDDIRITSRLKTNIGVHWSGFSVRDEFFNTIQPRVSARYLISDKLSAKASFVQMNQFIHLLTNSGIGLPTDLWVPVTDKVPVQKSLQYAGGLAYTHPKGYEFSVEGYYKTMDNVIEYKEGSSFFNSTTDWDDKIEIGQGRSYGAELFVQKKQGRLTGMAGYTLSWTKRQFDNLNNGEVYPYRYDRRHDLKIAAIYELTDNIEVSADWVYGTGNAITLPIAYQQGPDGQDLLIYGKRNGFRMPAYHRGDVSIKFSKERKNWERAWVISVYNVYNRRNPFYLYSSKDEGGNSVFKQASLFPVIPSISYQFKF